MDGWNERKRERISDSGDKIVKEKSNVSVWNCYMVNCVRGETLDNAAQFGLDWNLDLDRDFGQKFEIKKKEKRRPVALCCIWRHEREKK